MKKVIVLLFLLFGLFTAYNDGVFDLSADFITGSVIVDELDPVEDIYFEILFCQVENCTQRFLELAEGSRMRCSFYDLDVQEIIDVMQEKDPITIDNHNAKDVTALEFVSDGTAGLMHNKFCVINESLVWSGSTNPTFNGFNRNDNNVLIMGSEYLVQNYLDEYYELLNGDFNGGDSVEYSRIDLPDGGYVKNAFCPEDDCREIVLDELSKAEKSIYFMTFSFTDVGIAEVLIDKSDYIEVEGVMESKRFNQQYNVYRMLNGTNVTAIADQNKYTMHHKVFIVDEDTVITGSYNPTKSGDSRNDENLLVIKDDDVASRFLEEYSRVVNLV